RTWLEEDRVGRRLHAHLTTAAGEWEARDRDPGELYRGARLAGALDWGAQHDDQLNELEREFVRSSRMDAERTERGQRAQNRRLRSLLLGVGVLLVLAVIAGIVALAQGESATNQAGAARAAARVALARQLGAQAVSEPRLDRAMLLAREALNLDRSPQTEGSLLATLQRNPTVLGAFALPVDLAAQLAVSPDGRTLAVSHSRFNDLLGYHLGDIRFYDPRTHAPQRAPLTHFAGVRPPVYASDGSLLVYPTAADTPSIAVHDTRTSAVSQLYLDALLSARLAPDLVHATILIAPDRRTVYCVYGAFDIYHDRTQLRPGPTYLARWSLPSGRLLSTNRIDARPILTAGLAASGARLLVVDAHSVSVFDAGSARRVSSVAISPTSAAPAAAAISPDGSVVAIASQAGQLSFVDPATGTAHPGARAQYRAVKSLTYSPDGNLVASTGNDNRVIVWDSRTKRPSEVLTAPAEHVQDVAFSPDGHTLYTSSLGGILLAWDLTGKRSFGQHVSLGTGAPCCGPLDPLAPPLALSPDGATFAVAVGRSTVGLFSARTLTKQATFNVDPGGAPITALAWSPTAPVLAVAGHSGLVQLWRVDGAPRLARALTGLQRLAGQPEAVQALAFSPDGRLLAATDTNVALQQGGLGIDALGKRLALLAIWRTSTGSLLGTTHDLGTGTGRYGALTFSDDGSQLAVSGPDGNVEILDPNSRQVPLTLSPLGSDDTVSLAFARNGTLATGTEGGIVQLWNPRTGNQLTDPVAVAAGPVTTIAFDPTGRRFATTGGPDGTVKLWTAPTLQQQGTALTTEPGAATAAAFEPGGEKLLVIDDRGNAFTWPTSLAAWQQRACTIAGRNLTREEWSRYVPGQPYTLICR
ncbi:MAG: WD40 repeat domain-containing protein, partial [Solirubrobacteraceae bacterium]